MEHENTSENMTTQTIAHRQLRCFEAYMNVYNNNAFADKEHETWIKEMMIKHPELCKTTLVYHIEDKQDGFIDNNGVHVYGTDDKIRHNLMFPIPIYWGQARTDMFSWDNVKKNLGYSEANTRSIPDELRHSIRYAIVGKVKVKAHHDLPERDSHVIHTEGVNLESTDTAAYKAMIPGKNKYDILSDYYNKHRAILKLIVETAMTQVKEQEHAFIQAPMIGAGCFLRGIEGTGISVQEFLMQQVFAMISVMNAAPKNYNFTYKLCIFNTEEFSNDVIAAYQTLVSDTSTTGSNRFQLGMNTEGGNVLCDVPYGMEHQKVFVVNPGDLRSFIGNGMSNERSVEGFVVANAQGYNPQWQNTSFLHNPYFNPDIFTPDKIANSEYGVWKHTQEW